MRLSKIQIAVEDNEKQRGICVAVKSRILRKMTFMRQGFDAKLEMDNAGDTTITKAK